MNPAIRRTFTSLGVRNFRLYFFGQVASITGMWMQVVAQSWLVLQLTGSGVAVGLVTGLQYLPLMLGAPWSSVIIDRFDRRRMLMVTQGLMGAVATAVWIASATGVLTVGGLYVASGLYGLVQPFDNPARRLFVLEMVGRDRLANAVGLNAAVFTTGQMVGPALAGVLISVSGSTICFFLNALSYGAILLALARMRPSELAPVVQPEREKGHVKQGVRYIQRTPDVRWTMLLTTVASMMLLNYPVILPLLAERSFEGGPGMFGGMFAVLSVGSVLGALVTAARGTTTMGAVVMAAGGFGLVAVLVSMSPSLWVALPLLLLLGAADQLFSANSGAYLQMATEPIYRARVIALYSAVFVGSKGISGLVAGSLSELMGPKGALAVAGVATLAMAAVAYRSRSRGARGPRPA